MQALVVDDDIVSRMALVDLLAACGVFGQGAGALEAARQSLADGAQVDPALEAVADAVRRQSNRMRASNASPGRLVPA